MPKTLILVRHSKAENRNNLFGDIKRPLTKEGKADSLKIANLLLRSGIKPDFILSSSATRASQTTEIFSNVLKTETKNIRISRKFYYCSSKYILDHIVGIKEDINCVLIVAHNPGISDLARGLSSGRECYMDNTQVIILEYDIDHWYQVVDHNPVVFQNHRVQDIPDHQ
jgi:phosphohistidine phosphatase